VEGAIALPAELWPDLDDCFGCGPANPHGLRIAGLAEQDGWVVAEWTAAEHHCGYPGVVHGGVLSAALDEITGWAANVAFRRRDGDELPAVTAQYTVSFHAPASTGEPLSLRARVVEMGERSAQVEATVSNRSGAVASCQATYVKLREPRAG
jgi:uncharacterized protein (TIGR00369 family)